MKITIKDIANLAGVSITTVSKILNKKDKNISEATRRKVLGIIKDYNYVPNTIARSLVTRKTKTIGLVIPDITNPFFPEVARGAEDKANEAGYNIIFCNTDDDLEKEEEYINMLIEKMVDGIILAQSDKRKKGFRDLKTDKIPIILIDRDMDYDGIKGKVLVDNFKGAYKGVSHLLERGYRKIAFITGPLITNTAVERLEGYKEALKSFNIPYNEDYVLAREYKREWGSKAINILLNKGIDVDAVFCGNDLIALSVMNALKESGKSIPKDLGILGFDDIYMANLTEPKLTTIRQPKYDIGYKAVELLIEVLENPNNEQKTKIILETELVIREST